MHYKEQDSRCPASRTGAVHGLKSLLWLTNSPHTPRVQAQQLKHHIQKTHKEQHNRAMTGMYSRYGS